MNVPKDIAVIVERGMACLDNNKFWGAPNATRAVIWTLLPGAGDGKPDSIQTLQQSMQIAEQKGVRLAFAMNAVAAQARSTSRVVPAMSVTMAASRPANALSKPDLPALGRPAITTFIPSRNRLP